jgi:transcriptional regulator with XRE-family HTH domain
MDRITVGKKLAEIRERYGRTQSQLARESGTHLAQIQNTEAGRSFPRIDILEKLLKVCGMSLTHFFAEIEGIGPKNKGSQEHESLHQMLQDILDGNDEAADWISGNVKTFHQAHVISRRRPR